MIGQAPTASAAAVALGLAVTMAGACARDRLPDTMAERLSWDGEPGELFLEAALPVLERRCASPACHGVPEGSDHSAVDNSWFALPLDDSGVVSGEEQVVAARASAAAFVDPWSPPAHSPLLRTVVPPALGGLPHTGGATFSTWDDPDLQALAAWVAAEEEGGRGVDPAELTELELRFAQDVLPVLAQRRCMTAACHGPSALLSTLRQRAGIDGLFSAADIRANYGNARKFIALDGPAAMSRLLLKALPLGRGGILHKGGNDGFFGGDDDPDVVAISGWIDAEREAVVGAAPPVVGVIYASGPSIPRGPFDVTQPWWGSDLFAVGLPDGPSDAPLAPDNLTAGLHGGRADIRDPAVDHDGRRVAFAMRRDEGDGMNIYELDMASEELRQITFDRADFKPGAPPPFNVSPTYAPDGHIWFVSTRSAELADGGRRANTDLWEVDPADPSSIRRRTWAPNLELEPAFLRYGGVGGEIAFTSTRRFGDRFNAPIFRFPPGLQTEYHVHFGTQRDGESLVGIQDTPFGVHVVAALPEDAVWGAGALAFIDRNFGPDITAQERIPLASMPRFAHTMTYGTPRADAEGVFPGGLFRDPFPLPDGRLLAAAAPGAMDPRQLGAAPDFGVRLLDVRPDPETGRLRVMGGQVVADAPGRSDLSPVAVVVRAREPMKGHAHEDWESPTGVLNMFDLGLFQGIVETLEPRAKQLRDDLAAVRILAARPRPATLDVDPTAAPTSDPVEILGELPLAQDTSFFIEIPANRAIRFQPVDEHGMAVGADHLRWVFANPGETLHHSTKREVYDHRCAGCHGGLGGDPSDAAVPAPDAITSASVSYSTHAGADPLRPMAPMPVGLAGPGRVVDYEASVAPLLDRSCAVAGCHAGGAPAGGLRLTEAPGAPWVGDRARNSPLVDRVRGDGACPPPGAPVPPLTDAEVRMLIEWVDTGAVTSAESP